MFVPTDKDSDFRTAAISGYYSGQGTFIEDLAMLVDCGMHRQAQGDAILTTTQVLDMTSYRDIFVTVEYRDYDLGIWSDPSRLAQ